MKTTATDSRRKRTATESKGRGIALFLCLLGLSGAFWSFPLLSFGAFEDVGAGARATGMGNAFVAVADDAYSLYYNPAGLGTLTSPQLVTSYSRLFIGLSDDSKIGQSFLGYAHPLKKGERGTIAGSWQNLSLTGLYKEQAYTLSYGRLVKEDFFDKGDLYGGLTFKYLGRSVGNPDNIANVSFTDSGSQTGGQDPVLKKGSKNVPDADVGFLYQLRKDYSIGLAVTHLMQPNIAFSGTEKLKMGQKLGFAYTGKLTNVTLELQRLEGPTEEMDTVFVLGGERWFETKSAGEFALRGALANGNRDFRQLSLGGSYRISKFQLDYAFVLPIDSVEGTSGNQRFGLSFLFGGKTAEDEASSKALQELGLAAAPASRAEKARLDENRAKARQMMAQSRELMQAGRYLEAAALPIEAMKLDPSDKGVAEYYRRLSFVAESLPSLNLQDKAQSTVHSGVADFLNLKDASAVKKVSYGLSLNPSDVLVDQFLARLEKFTSLQAERVKGGTSLALVDQKLMESLMAFKQGQYAKVVSICQEVLDLEPNHTVALQRMGSALFVMKDYSRALQLWKRAYDLESDPLQKKSLERYMEEVQKKLKAQETPSLGPSQ